MVTALVLLLLWSASSLAAETFLCAGTGYATDVGGTAKVAAAPMRARTGTRNALIVFARFADSDAAVRPPDWSSRFFDPDTPGTFSHFYDTMSQSRLRVRGEVAPRYYRASRPSADYVGDTGNTSGRYGNLVAEILPQVDRDIDFRRFDNDGASWISRPTP